MAGHSYLPGVPRRGRQGGKLCQAQHCGDLGGEKQPAQCHRKVLSIRVVTPRKEGMKNREHTVLMRGSRVLTNSLTDSEAQAGVGIY